MESWRDFFGYVKAADFEDELRTLLQQKDELGPGLDVDDGPDF